MRRRLKLYKSPVPPYMVTKLRYADCMQLKIDAVVLQDSVAHIYQANSISDPDWSGVGHQPRGFDQLMALYDHYTVLGSKITVTFTNVSTTNASIPITCAIVLKDDNVTLVGGSWYDVAEQPRVRKGTIAHPEGDQGTITLSKGFGTQRFFHRGINADSMRGSAANSPSDGAFFHILCQTCGVPATDRFIDIQVVIDYVVKLTEPKTPAAS